MLPSMIDVRPQAVQRALGEMLRGRVAGPDAQAKAERIWLRPGTREFSSADPIWQVHDDASMFAGGIAALLLQSLHPLAMAGVAGHSGYKSDPWGRLQRTSEFLAATTFGTVDTAEAAIARVREIHTRVRGKDEQGRSYRASDPHLLLWVHVAEVYCFLSAYQRFGPRKLSAAEADTYVRQTASVARRLGSAPPPESTGALTSALVGFRAELEQTPAAVEAARFLLLNPPLPLWARPGYGTLAAAGLSLLPRWARRELGVAMPLLDTRPAEAVLGGVGVRAVRWGLAGLRTNRQLSDSPA